MNLFREKRPIRSQLNQEYSSYRRYKPKLIDDFNESCGYCNDNHHFLGGSACFHIDHFIPKTKFKEFENDYDNLVYSCPICNYSKSDVWISNDPDNPVVDNKGFVDPCDAEYDRLFKRNNLGEIIPQNELGEFIFKQLNLGLIRHRRIWQIEQVRIRILKLQSISERFEIQNLEIDNLIRELQSSFFELIESFRAGV